MIHKSASWVFFYFLTFVMLHDVYGNQIEDIEKETKFEKMFAEFQERYDKHYDSKKEYQARFEV